MLSFCYRLALQRFILSPFSVYATYKMGIAVKARDMFPVLPFGLACFSGLHLQGLFRILQFL